MIDLKKKNPRQHTLIYEGSKGLNAWTFEPTTDKGVTMRKKNSISLDKRVDDYSEEELKSHLEGLLKPLSPQVKEASLIVSSESLFSFRIEIPELDKEDLQSFIEIEADQHLPFSSDQFYLSQLRSSDHDSKDSLILAIQRTKVDPVLQSLKSLGWNVTSVTVDGAGIEASDGQSNKNEGALLLGPDHLSLAIKCNGQLWAIRQFPHHSKSNDLSGVARDIKISLAQVPVEAQKDLQTLRCIALPRIDNSQASSITIPGLDLAKVEASNVLIEAIAGEIFRGHRSAIEFLPPKPNKFEKIIERFNSKRNFWVGTGGAGIAAIVILAFFLQSQKLKSLENKWSGISTKVGELEKIQSQIREFRSWYQDDYPTLVALKSIFEAFPERGEIWLKQMTVRKGNVVRCTGGATSSYAILDVRKRLLETPGISDLQELPSSGDNPIYFSFQFTWNGQMAKAPQVTSTNVAANEVSTSSEQAQGAQDEN